MKNKNKNRRRERGQSLVEAALALPVVIMLMLGMLDLGRAYFILVELNDAADEGAAYASLNYTDVSGIQTRAVDSATMVTINPGDVTITLPPLSTVGQPITVTTAISMQLFTPFVSQLVGGGNLPLQGRSIHPIIVVP